MKYYILEGNMKPDIPQGPEFKKILDAHHAVQCIPDPGVREGVDRVI